MPMSIPAEIDDVDLRQRLERLADLDEQRKMMVLELLRGEILNFVS